MFVPYLIVLAGCPGGQPSLDERIDAFVEAQGLDFAPCGAVELDATCPDEPASGDAAAIACLVDAYATCSPSRLDVTQSTEEGDPIRRVYFVYPNGAQDCAVQVFTDDTEDAYAGEPGVHEETCWVLSEVDTCPWLGVDDCYAACDDDSDCG